MNRTIDARGAQDPCTGTEVTGEQFIEDPLKRGLHVKDVDSYKKLSDILLALGAYTGFATPFSEVAAVVTGVETTLLSYTVTHDAGMDFLQAVASGDNIGKYRVKVNGVTRQMKRSYWSDFNVEFDMRSEDLIKDDVVTVTVISSADPDPAPFNASIIGGLK